MINDTTLRDGEQTAGVAFQRQEKIDIAERLYQAGVNEFEVGVPAMSAQERDTVKQLCQALPNAQTMAWCRLRYSDLNACRNLGLSSVHISIPVSEQQRKSKLRISEIKLLGLLSDHIKYANDLGLRVSVGMEDASRGSDYTLMAVARAAEKAGAFRVRFADTLGILDPFNTYQKIALLKQVTSCEVEMHAHNDLGLATANTLAAIKAGADSVNTTVMGLGERAGNAALEEVVLALTVQNDQYPTAPPQIDLSALTGIAQQVSIASGREINRQKSAIGDAIFTHESGLHLDGLSKDTQNYEAFPPSLLGKEHRLVIGKHSGRRAIQRFFSSLNIHLDEDRCWQVQATITQFAETNKRNPSAVELKNMIDPIFSEVHP